MKVNHDLNRIMKHTPHGHRIREERKAGAILASCILICTIIIIIAVFVTLIAR